MQAERQHSDGAGLDVIIDPGSDASSTSGPDAELLRRIGMVEQFRADYLEARATRKSLLGDLRDDPEYRRLRPNASAMRIKYHELAQSTGYHAADIHCQQLFDRYDKAVRAVMLFRARTLRGVQAKLRLGRRAASRGDCRIYDYGDYEWLGFALADLHGW